MTYLITFACYGGHLHGEERGAVDRWHNRYGGPLLAEDARRVRYAEGRMGQDKYVMDGQRRAAVLEAIRERCLRMEWPLLAAHVRTNHVHVVVEADAMPERVMNDLKAFASRYLNELHLDNPETKRWARHGSTRRLFNRQSVEAAIEYVVERQG